MEDRGMRINQVGKIHVATRKVRATALFMLSLFACAWPAAARNVSEAKPIRIAQVDAFLPNKYGVPETDSLPIDGVWTISTIGKKIRVERGRAYAVDSWLHLFVLQIQPDMVVLKNFQRTGAGQYAADDLPLLGPATFQLRPDGNMSVRVESSLGPVSYDLINSEVDDPAALEAEIAALDGDAISPPPFVAPLPSPEPGDVDPLADCIELGVDEITGDVVCLD